MARKPRENPAFLRFLIANAEAHPNDLAALAARNFGVTRTTANRYLKKLVDGHILEGTGATKARRYTLVDLVNEAFSFPVNPATQEDVIWRERVAPLLEGAPPNVMAICQYGVTEMINNVIDHSGSRVAYVNVQVNAQQIQIRIHDVGVGIFNKIQRAFDLADPRHALLELSKGKLTTDPDRHTGEGVFFTSRLFDRFSINSSSLFYQRELEENDEWLIEAEDQETPTRGTFITLMIDAHSTKTTQQIMRQYEDDEYGFSKTHVPVRLGRYGNEQLVSRSQARRILARFEKFDEVMLDFRDVPEIGQAFADEIFRVFKNERPEITVHAMRASPDVRRMIEHVQNTSGAATPATGLARNA